MKKNKIFLIIVFIINIIVRLPALFDPVSYGDECIYLALGNAFNQGQVFYKDIHDNKPPLLYIAAAFSGANLVVFRLITIIVNTINIYIIYRIACKLFSDKNAALFSAVVFSFLSLLPEGRVANGEIYMIMPASLGLLLALQVRENKKNKAKLWFLSGICFSVAFLFKVPIVFDFIGLILALFIFSTSEGESSNILGLLKKIIAVFKNKNFYFIVAGFVFPILISILYYSLHGAFTPYVRSALLQNIGYLSSWGGSSLGLYLRFIAVVVLTIIFYVFRKKTAQKFNILALLTLFGMFGVFLSERPYPHYLIEIVPWISLLLTLIVFNRKTLESFFAFILFFLLGLGFIKYNFWWYKNIPYYKNFISYVRGKKTKQQFYSYFGSKVKEDYQIADFLKENTSPKDRVFVWGDGSCIYAKSKRIPPGRYTVNYHIYDFNGFQETLEAVKKQQPEYIVFLQSADRDFPELKEFVKMHYQSVMKTDYAVIYEKK